MYSAFTEIKPATIQWLWPNRIPLGKITLLIGDPGIGKSLFTLDLAARLSRGAPFPGVSPSNRLAPHLAAGDSPAAVLPTSEISNSQISNSEISNSSTVCPIDNRKSQIPNPPSQSSALLPQSSLILAAEDDPSDTIRPRLEAAGADLSRIFLMRDIVTLAPNPPRNNPQNDEPDTPPLELIETALRLRPDISLIIIDPITSFLGYTDRLSFSRTRTVLASLADLAARYNIAVILTTRLNKPTDASRAKTLYRATGSLAFASAARAIWLLTPAPDPTFFPTADSQLPNPSTPNSEISNPQISNSSTQNSEISNPQISNSQISNPEISNSPNTPVLFLPIKLNHAALPPGLAFNIINQKIVYLSVPITAQALEPQSPITRAAMDWLTAALADGPIASKKLQDQARENAISYAAFRRAKSCLGVQNFKIGYRTNWWSRLPNDPRPVPTFDQELDASLQRRTEEMFASIPGGAPCA